MTGRADDESVHSPRRGRTPPLPGIGAPAPFALVGTLLVAALVAFAAAAVAFLAAADELARGALAAPDVLLAAHLLTLGFLPLAVAGAALHVLPVFLRVPARAGIGWLACGGLLAGPVLAVAIARHAETLAAGALAATLLGLAALLSEVARLLRSAPRGKLLVVSRVGVVGAAVSGALSFALGVVLFSVRWQSWHGIPHERLIAIHLHLAVVGCLTLLIVTVGRVLGPMLAMAPTAPRRSFPTDEVLLLAGTWLVVAGLARATTALALVGAITTLVALVRFGALVLRTRGTRRTPAVEAPLGHLLVGLGFLAQATALAAAILLGEREPEVLAAYALLALLGWAAGVTLGHVGRLLALSAWTWWPPGERPRQAAFYARRAWTAELLAFSAGVELLALGTLAGSAGLARAGAGLVLVSALVALAAALGTTWPRAASAPTGAEPAGRRPT